MPTVNFWQTFLVYIRLRTGAASFSFYVICSSLCPYVESVVISACTVLHTICTVRLDLIFQFVAHCSAFLSFSLPFCPFVCLSVFLSVFLYFCLSSCIFTVFLYFCLCFCPFVCFSISMLFLLFKSFSPAVQTFFPIFYIFGQLPFLMSSCLTLSPVSVYLSFHLSFLTIFRKMKSSVSYFSFPLSVYYSSPLSPFHREYWMIYIGPSFFATEWFGSLPNAHPLHPPLSRK
jgi:hypothetical protein